MDEDELELECVSCENGTEENEIDMLELDADNTTFEDHNVDTQQKECGTIFVKNQTLSIICKFCVAKFKTLEMFQNHLKCHIDKCDIPNENSLESTTINDNVYEKDVLEPIFHISIVSNDNNAKKCNTDSLKNEKLRSKLIEKDEVSEVEYEENNQNQKLRLYDSEASNNSYVENSSMSYLKEGRFKCELCNVTFLRKRALKRHEKIHLNVVDYISEIALRPIFKILSGINTVRLHNRVSKKTHDMNENGLNYSNKSLACRYCSLRSFSLKDLKRHEASHHTHQRVFKCKICEKEIKTRSGFKVHMNNHENNTKQFKCETCGMSYTTKGHLQEHIRSKHLNERNYECQYCGKKFVTNSCRKVHEKIHIGEKSHQCDKCGKLFLIKSAMIVHRRKWHSSEAEKEKLMKHECKECGKRFFQNSALKKHMIVHTDARPFVCEICNATYRRKSSLQAHRTSHFDEWRYDCKVCGKKFKNYYSLYSHMKTHKVIKTT